MPFSFRSSLLACILSNILGRDKIALPLHFTVDFEVLLIDYLNTVSLDQVYSQALHLFRTDFQYWFSPSDIALVNKNNEQFRSLAVEEELLTVYFDPCTEKEADHFFSATQVIT